MRYYIKIFNKNTGGFVGYYKQVGRNSVTSMMNGMKYFDDKESALRIAQELDDGFLRDKDKHYYSAFVCVYGDSTKEPPKEEIKTKLEKEEELSDALETFVRKNSSKVER